MATEGKKKGWDKVDVGLLVVASACLVTSLICAFTVLPACMRNSPSKDYYSRHPDDFDDFYRGYEGNYNTDDLEQYIKKEKCVVSSVEDQKDESLCKEVDSYTEDDRDYPPPTPEPSPPRRRDEYQSRREEAEEYRQDPRDDRRDDRRDEHENNCFAVKVAYLPGRGPRRTGQLYTNVDEADIMPRCTYYICPEDVADPAEANLTYRDSVDCYYFTWRDKILYLEKPEVFTWYISAGFHSVFWPALVSALCFIVMIVRKLFNIAKNSAAAAENAASAVPPTYVPNLYVIGSESTMGMVLGVEKSPDLELNSLTTDGASPTAPQIIYSPPPEYSLSPPEASAYPAFPEEEESQKETNSEDC